MKKLIITAVLTVLLPMAVSAQTGSDVGTEISLGKDRKGEAWFTRSKFPTFIAGQRYMTAMYTTPRAKGDHVVLFFEVDCSDNTIRSHGAHFYTNMKKVYELDEVTEWANPIGPAAKMYNLLCTQRNRSLL